MPLARADPPPCVVEQVLELWLQEVTVWTGATPAATGSVFAERPALKDAVFNFDMRHSVRDAPLEALRAFRKAMGAALEQVRAAPGCAAPVDARALQACKAAERVADEACELDEEFFAATAAGAAAEGHQHTVIMDAARQAGEEAEEAIIVAAKRVAAARAARGAWAPPVWPEYPGMDADESEAGSEEVHGGGSGEAARYATEPGGSDSEPGDMSAEGPESKQELDIMDAELTEIAGLPVTNLADGRHTCACPPSSSVDAPEALVMLRVPVVKGMQCAQI